jgi:cation transport protein ChaC
MGLHIFGYGSLMWNPGFEHAGAAPAFLDGWRRSWCVKSTVYRGCADNPGYVLGLKRGGGCVGMLYELPDACCEQAIDYLLEREMRENGYTAMTLPVVCREKRLEATVFTSEGLGEPGRREIERAYRTARGIAGSNSDYIDATVRFLGGLAVSSGWPLPEDGLPAGLCLP